MSTGFLIDSALRAAAAKYTLELAQGTGIVQTQGMSNAVAAGILIRDAALLGLSGARPGLPSFIDTPISILAGAGLLQPVGAGLGTIAANQFFFNNSGSGYTQQMVLGALGDYFGSGAVYAGKVVLGAVTGFGPAGFQDINGIESIELG